MEQNGTGYQASPESPVLCVNNCGFFGTASTMNMCSKCHKDLILKQEQDKLVASSIESIVNGSPSSSIAKGPSDVTVAANIRAGRSESLILPTPASSGASVTESGDSRGGKEGPKRCRTCTKRVGLTGFNCRCGNVFCATHRYSDKHECPFDYRAAARDAIGKANPIIKAEKLDKI